MESEFQSLRPIEQEGLWRVLGQGNRFRPCGADALRVYREKVGVRGCPDTCVTAQHTQNALETIRYRSPALVWKSARGDLAATGR